MYIYIHTHIYVSFECYCHMQRIERGTISKEWKTGSEVVTLYLRGTR